MRLLLVEQLQVLSVMSMRGLTHADSASTASSFYCAATCSMILYAFWAIAALQFK